MLSFARINVFCPNKCRMICPNWGVNCPLTPRPVRLCKWLQEKQRDSQEKDTKAKKGELNQTKTVMMPCLYCSGVYSKSRVGDGWMNCGEFYSWAHKSVQGMNAARSFVTCVTKTGVVHFALQFWQLKKQITFECLFCNIFSEVTLKLEYTKCN